MLLRHVRTKSYKGEAQFFPERCANWPDGRRLRCGHTAVLRRRVMSAGRNAGYLKKTWPIGGVRVWMGGKRRTQIPHFQGFGAGLAHLLSIPKSIKSTVKWRIDEVSDLSISLYRESGLLQTCHSQKQIDLFVMWKHFHYSCDLRLCLYNVYQSCGLCF